MSGSGSAPRWRLGGELGAAHAHAAARVLPQLLGRVQMAEGARNGAEIVSREMLRNVGVVKRLFADSVQNFLRELGDCGGVADLARFIRLAVHIVVDLRAIRIGI